MSSQTATAKKYTRSCCALCGPPKLSQKTDPKTGLRYCCICFSDVRRDLSQRAPEVHIGEAACAHAVGSAHGGPASAASPERCFACLQAGSPLTEHRCETKQSEFCSSVILCVPCSSAVPLVSCPLCWAGDQAQLRRHCYVCPRLVDDIALVKSRLCTKCRAMPLSCYYCGLCSEDVRLMPCGRTAHCTRRVVICAVCAALHGAAVCAKCWSSGWQGRCFHCKTALPQSMSTRFCVSCHATHKDNGSKEILALESILHIIQYDPSPSYMDRLAKCLATSTTNMTWATSLGPALLRQAFWDRLVASSPPCALPCARLRLCGSLEARSPTVLDEGRLHELAPFTCEWQVVSKWHSNMGEGSKNCFMEVVDAMGSLASQRHAVNDVVQTATWGKFAFASAEVLRKLDDFRTDFEAYGGDWTCHPAYSESGRAESDPLQVVQVDVLPQLWGPGGRWAMRDMQDDKHVLSSGHFGWSEVRCSKMKEVLAARDELITRWEDEAWSIQRLRRDFFLLVSLHQIPTRRYHKTTDVESWGGAENCLKRFCADMKKAREDQSKRQRDRHWRMEQASKRARSD